MGFTLTMLCPLTHIRRGEPPRRQGKSHRRLFDRLGLKTHPDKCRLNPTSQVENLGGHFYATPPDIEHNAQVLDARGWGPFALVRVDGKPQPAEQVLDGRCLGPVPHDEQIIVQPGDSRRRRDTCESTCITAHKILRQRENSNLANDCRRYKKKHRGLNQSMVSLTYIHPSFSLLRSK